MMRLNLVLCLSIGVYGHGAMSFPPTRNTVNSYYCAACANGDGVCGEGGEWNADAKEASKLASSIATPLTAVVSGGMIDIEFYYPAFKKGHFVLELCSKPAKVLTEDCFERLERDPKDDRYGPFTPDHPEIFWNPDSSCASASESSPLKARFIIPKGVTSDHAVIRWHWQAGNSCDSSEYNGISPLPEITSWKGTINGQSCKAALCTTGTVCGTDCPAEGCNGNIFRNCADVKVIKGASSVVVTSSKAAPDAGGSDTADSESEEDEESKTTDTGKDKNKNTDKKKDTNTDTNTDSTGFEKDIKACKKSLKSLEYQTGIKKTKQALATFCETFYNGVF